METDACDTTEAELVALAGPENPNVNARWITKYIRLGLLPSLPSRPGRGQGPGRPARYAAATRSQLPALLAAQAAYGKNLRAVGWQLWKSGFQVDPKYWRDRLLSHAKAWERLKRLANGTFIERAARWINKSRNPNSIISSAKRRVGNNNIHFLGKVFSVMVGRYNSIADLEYDQDEFKFEGQLLAKALAIPVNNNSVAGTVSAWPINVTAFDHQFSRLSRYFAQDLYELIANLPHEEIELARTEFFQLWSPLAEFAKAASGKVDLPGMPLIAALGKSSRFEGPMLIGWICMRADPEFRIKAADLAEGFRSYLGRSTNGGTDEGAN